MAFQVFVSYRRADSAAFVDQLQAELPGAAPGVELVRDVEVIAAGEDFIDVLQARIDDADLMLAVMGPAWSGPGRGRPRIADPDDVVRREIAWRLRPRDTRSYVLGGPEGGRMETGPEAEPPELVPVLVGGARMPEARDLPPDIRELTQRQAVSVTGTAQSGFDLAPVIRLLEERAEAWAREDRRITEELEAMEAEMAGEARATGTPSPAAPDPQPQLRVAIAGFSHLGAWSCEIGPAVPGTAPTVTVEFQVRSDHSMTGSIITSTKGLFRTKRFHEPIQGRADLLFFQPAGAREVHPVIRLEGVRAGAQRFLQDIPVQERLGSVYVGSDARQSFVLKRTGGHGL